MDKDFSSDTLEVQCVNKTHFLNRIYFMKII